MFYKKVQTRWFRSGGGRVRGEVIDSPLFSRVPPLIYWRTR